MPRFKIKYKTVEEMPNYVEQLEEKDWERVKGYSKLSDYEKEVVKETYLRHMNAMGRDNRFDYYGAHTIKEVKRDLENQSINVFYKNGNWWHYTTKIEWW